MSTGEFVRRALAVAAIAVAIALAWLLRDVLISAFFAVIIAVGLTIPKRWFERWGLSSAWALGLSITLVTFGVITLAVLIIPTIAVQLAELVASAADSLDTLAEEYQDARGGALLESIFPDFTASPGFAGLQEALQAARPEESMQAWLVGSLALPVLQGLGVIAGVLFNFGLLWLIGIWFAVDPRSHVEASLYLFPRHRHARILEVWAILGETLITWLKAQFISIGITVALVILLLGVLLDMPNVLIVAVFAGIATFIPNIGAFLPLIPIAIFGLASPTPAMLPIWLAVYLLIQLVESNFITPLVVKVQLEIPAGALMVFQLIATVLFGPLGLLLAVPLLAVLIVLVRELYSYDILGLKPVKNSEVEAIAPSPDQPPLLETTT